MAHRGGGKGGSSVLAQRSRRALLLLLIFSFIYVVRVHMAQRNAPSFILEIYRRFAGNTQPPFILDQLGGRWRESCWKLTCWKAKFLGKVIDALTKGTPVTTGMFSHLSFRCDNSKTTYYNQPLSSRLFKISQGDICCFEQYLTGLPQRNVSFVLVTHGHDHHGSPADLNIAASKCFRKILEDDRINAYFVSQHRSNFRHPKLRFLPIGLGTGTFKIGLTTGEILALVERARMTFINSCEQKLQCSIRAIEANFNVAGKNSGEKRASSLALLQRALNVPVQNVYMQVNSSLTLERYAASAFVMSPAGTHHDCWRHHEALLTGAFPLVDEYHLLHKILPGLPVIYIKSWERMTRDDLFSKMDDIISADPPSAMPLTRAYWEEELESFL